MHGIVISETQFHWIVTPVQNDFEDSDDQNSIQISKLIKIT